MKSFAHSSHRLYWRAVWLLGGIGLRVWARGPASGGRLS